MAAETALIELPAKMAPEQVFEPKYIDKLIQEIHSHVDDRDVDLSTGVGRKKVASLAYRVARSKTYVDSIGKDLVAVWKNQAKAVDAERKRFRDALDVIQEEVRRPLNEWEAAEEARIAAFRAYVDDIELLGEIEYNSTSAQISQRLDELAAMLLDEEHCGEFLEEAQEAHAAAMSALLNAFEVRKEVEDKEVEFQRLQKAENARLQKEREDKIRDDATAAAQTAAQDAIDAEKRRADKAVEDERARVQAVAEDKEDADRLLREDKEHRETVFADTSAALQDICDITASAAAKIIEAVEAESIPNMEMMY